MPLLDRACCNRIATIRHAAPKIKKSKLPILVAREGTAGAAPNVIPRDIGAPPGTTHCVPRSLAPREAVMLVSSGVVGVLVRVAIVVVLGAGVVLPVILLR